MTASEGGSGAKGSSAKGSGPKGSGSWTPGARPKRFYREAVAALDAEAGDGANRYTVTLDGRPLRTPHGGPFRAPRAVAAAAAAEWAAVADEIDPLTMPVTRAVNAALELIPPQRDAVVAEIAGFGASDLVCYRAVTPEALAAREAAVWDPVVAWLAERHGVRLRLAAGVMHVTQSTEALQKLTDLVAAESDLGLAALSDLTALSGSLAIALAVVDGRLDAEAAWAASRVDEEYQISLWGRDAEAEAAADEKRAAFVAAARLAQLARMGSDDG